ncbi:S8 family peptidase [Kibdelosporangium aridum]|uniref:S8 family peptidase n=1 Tax=Kibdelosporangium aridum TaxID=2030 RepID=UPI0035EEFF4F
MSRSTRRWAATALVMVLPLALAPAGTAAAAPPAAAGSPTQVTLITGDKVALLGNSVQVTPAPRGRTVPFQEFTRHGDRYVVPDDAAMLIQSGRLDRELFNVTGLIRQGYDDAHTKSIPLLVEGSAVAARGTAPGGKVRRELPGLGMTAVDQGKADTGAFWRTVGGDARAKAGAVGKIWLNGKVKATLEQSVPQVGAPAAWQVGFTGDAVQVAVLDTGIDTDHPDLVGKVAQSKDFSGKGSVEDGHGHGTHVASTITGSGAASGGRYKGVAPGTTLAVGKVLADDGFATDDVVLAGMQWAAAEVRAKVVNMSLGSGPSDGTDPMSAAVNTLSRQYGTLFVIAAGNWGGEQTVSSPATADDALTVANVTKQDVLSPTSSRGPRLGDGALKPEIAAPGEAIVAARPAGVPPLGEPVGDAYQRIGGTSMATPHVAGAAAILAQQHPDWSGDRLKAALMSSAAPINANPFAVGTGRLDVARAIRTPVTATGSVSAYMPWPNQGAQKRLTVTWSNSGTTPITLDLQANATSANGQPAPDGLVSLAANSVTVQAGGNASVDVVVTAQADRAGTYSGIVSARTSDGAVSTRTAVSVRQQEAQYNLTATVLDRNGNPVQPNPNAPALAITNLDTGEFSRSQPGTVQLSKGRYAVHAAAETARPGQEPSLSFVSHPELLLDKDITQVFDARLSQPVSVEPDNAAARGGTHTMYLYNKIRDCSCTFGYYAEVDPRLQPMYAATLPGTRSDSFAFGQHRRANEPVLEVGANDGRPFQVNAKWYQSSDDAESLSLSAVHAGTGTAEEIAGVDLRGKLVVIDISRRFTTYEQIVQRSKGIKEAGGRLLWLNFLPDLPVSSVLGGGDIELLALPTLYSADSVTADRFIAYVKGGNATATYINRPFPTLRYELGYGVEHELTRPQVHKPKDRDLVPVRTSYYDNAPGEVRYIASREFFGSLLHSPSTQPAAAQQERTEYFTPGKWSVHWSSAWRGMLDDEMELRTGKSYRIAWNKAVAGPSFRGLTQTHVGEEPRPWGWRKDGVFDMWLPLYGDAAGRPRLQETFAGDDGLLSVYREGTLLQTTPVTDAVRVPVPDEAAAYRVTAEVHRTDPVWPLSKSVSGDWKFRSSATDEGKALPLLTVRYDPALNIRNQAPGGTGFSFPTYVERQDGTPRVATFTVDVSYDDGGTWQRAHTRRDGDRWTVSVKHPQSGYASLRANVTDKDGNSLQQTVIRAYQIGS